MIDEPKREPNIEEEEAAYAGPAPGANRFYVVFGTPGVRIAFLESEPNTKTMHFRSAVTLHPIDAVQLRDVLSEILARVEEDMKQKSVQGPDG